MSLTGLGRTLDDGHRHAVDWSSEAITERVDLVRNAVSDSSSLVPDALVQEVILTDDIADAAARVARRVDGLTPVDVLGAPYTLVGNPEQIADELLQHRDRWGFTSYVVRETAIDAVAAIIARLDQ